MQSLGYPIGVWVPMTAMPQRIAISHAFGALAATLVGVAEYYTASARRQRYRTAPRWPRSDSRCCSASLTVTGSFMAFGKLQEFDHRTAHHVQGQNLINLGMFAAAPGLLRRT